MSLLGHAPLLRAVADHLKLPSVAALSRGVGVQGVWRVTVYYHDFRAAHSAATLIKSANSDPRLEVLFERALGGQPLTHKLPTARVEAWTKALRRANFDNLPDAPDLPRAPEVDLWLIERAAGTYIHSVIVAPEQASHAYAQLVEGVRLYLPEALRQVQ